MRFLGCVDSKTQKKDPLKETNKKTKVKPKPFFLAETICSASKDVFLFFGFS